jgi:hypothetical protein
MMRLFFGKLALQHGEQSIRASVVQLYGDAIMPSPETAAPAGFLSQPRCTFHNASVLPGNHPRLTRSTLVAGTNSKYDHKLGCAFHDAQRGRCQLGVRVPIQGSHYCNDLMIWAKLSRAGRPLRSKLRSGFLSWLGCGQLRFGVGGFGSGWRPDQRRRGNAVRAAAI